MIERSSHGDGRFAPEDFSYLGEGTVIEPGVLVFHPETIRIGSHCYIGHNAILKGYFDSQMAIGDGTWIGQQCFFHSAGNITIGRNVGVGPAVRIITSEHRDVGREVALLHSPTRKAPVIIEEDADIGTGAILLLGVRIGRGAVVGAGAVVTHNVEEYAVVAGVPAVLKRYRAP